MDSINIINPDNVSKSEAETFEIQEAVRAIVFNKERTKIATQYSTNHFYHKLPGGGVEGQENLIEALKRECLEELGFNIEIESELGSIVEYRKNEKQKVKRISHCYVAQIVGNEQGLNLDAAEKRSGFVVEWMTLDEALVVWEKEIAEASQDGSNKYILPRDLSILKHFVYTLK